MFIVVFGLKPRNKVSVVIYFRGKNNDFNFISSQILRKFLLV